LKLLYYPADTGEGVHVRSPKFPIAKFKGQGNWQVVVLARHVPAGGTSPSETQKTYIPVDDSVEILLEEFLPPDRALADGKFTFNFSVLGVQPPPIVPPCLVTLDQTRPKLFRLVAQPGGEAKKIELSDEGEAFLRRENRIRIQVDDLSPCKVLINGDRAIPYEDGTYEVAISGESRADLEIDATDAAGNQRVVTQTIRLDGQDPVIELPGKSQTVVFDEEATVEFAVADDTAVELVACRLNDVNIPATTLSDGRYRVDLHLQSGWNEVLVEAHDKTGRHSAKTHRIEYDPSTTRIVSTAIGSKKPEHTQDPETVVASFQGPEDQEIVAVASFLVPGQARAQEIARKFRLKDRKLEIRLSDFSEKNKPLSDGRFGLSYSTPTGDAADKLSQGIVYLDRKRPAILLEGMDANGNRIEKPADDKAEIFVHSDTFKVHVVDESPFYELRINGVASVFRGDGIYVVPATVGTVEVVAEDLAGNSTIAVLQPRRDRQEPRIYTINVPAEGSVGDQQFHLAFHASDDIEVVGVTVSLNGKAVPVAVRDADLCRATLSLRRGTNEIVITAWDASSRKTVATRALNLQTSTATDDIAILFEDNRYLLLIRAASGKGETFVLPESVLKIVRAPPLKNKFMVSTASDPDVPMLLVKGGTFPLQGNPETEVDEQPFLIDRYEVSVERFSRFQRSRGSKDWIQQLPEEFRDPQQPAVLVDWGEATAFTDWAGKELPTARQHGVASAWDGKRYRRYPWGEDFASGGLPRKWQPYPPKVTVATGDVSPAGVVGLGGGVREWCRDTTPYKPDHRILRGGSQVHPRGAWGHAQELTPAHFNSTRQDSAVRSSKMSDVGVRCILRLIPIPDGDIVGGRTVPGKR
jgi:hypothetical protein